VDTDAFDPSRYEKSACRAAAGLPPDRIVILAGGTLIPLKRHAVLIAALAALLRQGSPVHLAITAGDAGSQHAERIRRLAAELKVEARITWLPFQFEMARLYAAADIFALASDCEGLPRSALEAMSMRLPVVAANRGGSCEAVVDGTTGLLARSEPLEFSRALSRLVHDAPARYAMGYEGRRRAFDFWSAPKRAGVMETLLAGAAGLETHRR
jgi:glycosyltransferase involved in cell wall biosynthesis